MGAGCPPAPPQGEGGPGLPHTEGPPQAAGPPGFTGPGTMAGPVPAPPSWSPWQLSAAVGPAVVGDHLAHSPACPRVPTGSFTEERVSAGRRSRWKRLRVCGHEPRTAAPGAGGEAALLSWGLGRTRLCGTRRAAPDPTVGSRVHKGTSTERPPARPFLCPQGDRSQQQQENKYDGFVSNLKPQPHFSFKSQCSP